MAQHTSAAGETDVPAGLGKPARQAPAVAGSVRLEQLTTVTEATLLKLNGISPKASTLQRRAVEARGQSFGDAEGGHA